MDVTSVLLYCSCYFVPHIFFPTGIPIRQILGLSIIPVLLSCDIIITNNNYYMYDEGSLGLTPLNRERKTSETIASPSLERDWRLCVAHYSAWFVLVLLLCSLYPLHITDSIWFLEGDPTLSYPYHDDGWSEGSVSVEKLVALSVGVPLLGIVVGALRRLPCALYLAPWGWCRC